MRRMYSENQLIALILKYAQGGDLSVFAPAYSDESTYAKGDIVSKDDKFYQAKADIETAEEWTAEHWNEVTFEEALKPYLNGKYVRIMDAPSSTTLTDEEITQIEEGVFINGNFLGFKNPILCPSKSSPSTRGWIVGTESDGEGALAIYVVVNNVISIDPSQPKIFTSWKSNTMTIGGVVISNSDTKFTNKILYESLDNVTSGDTIATSSALGKALINHLDVEINGYRARYEYTDGNYVVYSSKTEVNSGLKLQVNMISYNTTNGELSFNSMTFTPDA